MPNYKMNIYSILAFLLALTISLQLGFLFDGAYRFIPLRVLFLSVLILILYKIIKNQNIKLKSNLIFLFGGFLSSAFLLIWYNQLDKDLLIKTYLNYIYLAGIIVILGEILPKLNLSTVKSSFYVGLNSISIVLLIETYIRITNPTLVMQDDDFSQKISATEDKIDGDNLIAGNLFYVYKYSSIMFFDSNYVGLLALAVVIGLIFYREVIKRTTLSLVLLLSNIIFVVLSFSRAAIFTLILILVFHYIYKNFYKSRNKKNIIIITFISIIVGIILSYEFILSYLNEDSSFATKIMIVNNLLNSFGSAPLQNQLFGYGFIDGGYKYSYKEGAYAHSFVALMVGEIGIIGLLIYCIIFLMLCIKAQYYGLLISLVFFIPGFSLIDPWQIFYFWILIYIYYIQKKIRLEKCILYKY